MQDRLFQENVCPLPKSFTLQNCPIRPALQYYKFLVAELGPRSHYSVFVSIRFCCIEATRSHYSVFVQKRREKLPFLCVHTDLPDNKNAAKNIRFCAFKLLRFCETHCCILERFQKPPFLCVHIDQMRFQKPPLLWISTFDSVFENLRFCGVFVRISVNTFTKTEVFLSVLYKNGVV